MKLEPKKLLKLLVKPIMIFRRFFTIIIILVVVSTFGYLVWRINTLSNAEPSEDDVDTALTSVNRPAIDPNAINKIKELQGENVNIQSLFPFSRDNPFQE